jgi:hypothetical protein
MDTSVRRRLVAAAAAALAVGGAGAAIAATQLNRSPGAESKAVVSDAAKQLGVQPSELSSALRKALKDRVDAAVADKRISKAQGDELKKRIDSNEFPLFAGPGLGFGFGHEGFRGHDFSRHHGFPGLSTAATYLGLSESQLSSKLESGKSLADIAKAQEGKSAAGLVSALKGDLQKKLDKAVSDGNLTKSQEARILSGAGKMITAMVDGKFAGPPGPPRGGRGWFHDRNDSGSGFGFRGEAPPAAPGTDT